MFYGDLLLSIFCPGVRENTILKVANSMSVPLLSAFKRQNTLTDVWGKARSSKEINLLFFRFSKPTYSIAVLLNICGAL